MGDNKGDNKPPSQPQQLSSSSSPKDPLKESPEQHRPLQPRRPPPFNISAPLYVPVGGASTAPNNPFEPQFETTPKRLRYSSASSQWRLLSPTSSSQPKPTAETAAASSSETATSSPARSPVPSLSAASGQETSKPAAGEAAVDQQQQAAHQMRKGKYVSPVWKPNEMLWLARAWRVQYQGGGRGADHGPGSGAAATIVGDHLVVHSTRGKTRADKDREVAEFLNRQGIHRDAKTAGTKWDNMLGEFRKVYEWERGGERDRVGKSYFRLSPYERKLHRLPASFDEEVFDELSQFMGSRIRTPNSHGRSTTGGCLVISAGNTTTATTTSSGDDVGGRHVVVVGTTPTRPSLLPPPPFKEDDSLINLPLSSGRSGKQFVITSGGGGTTEGYFVHGGRGGSSSSGALGFDPSMEAVGVGVPSSKELRRIGKVRMTWEESVSLWAEEGEHHRGRVKLQGSSFLNADELTFFDDSMVACTMEAFEDGALKGFSVDKFVSGQHIKVFGRRKSSPSSSSLNVERVPIPLAEPSSMRLPPLEYQDPTDYYMSCLRVPPPTLPSLFELPWYILEPPPEELRFPLRKDVYRDLPPMREQFFTTTTSTSETPLDCKSFTLDVVSSIVRNPTLATPSSRDSFIGLWDDCINRLVSKFCSLDLTIVRKSNMSAFTTRSLQDQWPNVTGFVRNWCLWRGEETDQIREGQDEELLDPSSTIVAKLMWTYMDLPYVLGYYAVGHTVTFCALCRSTSSQDRIVRTDLYSLDLSSPSERMKALVPCYRIGGLLTLLADRCSNSGPIYSDFERLELGNGVVTEMTPNTMRRFFPSKRKWAAVKEIYDILDQRIPHAEFICESSERELALVFKPRGVRIKPTSWEQLVESLIYVTKALVALHDLSFMHRDLSWDKVMMMRKGDGDEWFVCGFDEAVGAPQLNPYEVAGGGRSQAPEMGRGLHGVQVDVWGVGNLVRTCGVSGEGVPKLLRELQNRCLDQNPEKRPTAADCYHHLSQLQSSLGLQPSSGAGASY